MSKPASRIEPASKPEWIFEDLLSEISTRLIRAHATDVDREIQHWLAIVARALGAERGTVVDYSDGFERATHEVVIDDVAAPRPVLTGDDFPWATSTVASGEIVCFSRLEELPEEAATDLATYRQFGTRSNLIVPLQVGEVVVGALSIATLTEELDWSEKTIKRLKLVASVFANALARKRSERRLALAEEHRRLASDAGASGVWDWNLGTGEMVVDPRLKGLLGFEDHEIEDTEDAWAEHAHPQDKGRLNQTLRRVIDGEQPAFQAEHRMIHRDGSVKWFLARGRVFIDDDGQPFRVLGTDTCITDLKQSELGFAEREARLRRLVETSQAVPWEAQAYTWRFIYVGPQVGKLLGYPIDLWYEPGFWAAHIHPDDREETLRASEEATPIGEPYDLEYRMIAADGTPVWIHDIVTIEPSVEGPPILRGFLFDVTNRKRAQEELSESRNRLQTISDALPVFVAYLDPDERYRFVNAMYERFFKIPSAEMTGMKFADLHTPELRETMLPFFQRALEGKDTQYQQPVPRADGSLQHLRVHLIPDSADDGTVRGVFAVANDVTDYVEYESRLLQAMRSAERAEERLRELSRRLINTQEEERSRIARELHDDLIQQLAAVAIEIGTLRARLPADSEALLARLEGLQDRIQSLASDARSISHRLHPAALEHLGLAAALKSYCEELHQLRGIEVRFIDTLEEQVSPEVSLGLFRIAQESLQNVARHSRAEKATVQLSRHNGAIELTVSDPGIGFDAVKAPGGLGLVSMRERVELLGGTLLLTSAPGEGSAVVARVPLVADA